MNARSLGHKQELEILVQGVQYEFIEITKTQCDDGNIAIEGYKLFKKNRKGGGGSHYMLKCIFLHRNTGE